MINDEIVEDWAP